MGTELFKHYTAEKTPFLKCGYNNLWNVYRGTHKARKIPVCIFVLEKKNLKKITKNTKDVLVNIRKSPQMLMKFKHPNILGLVEPLVEDKNCLGFVTERFSYSLASWLEFVNPSKLEIKSVLIEVCKSLIFLHEDAHVIHNNLSLDSIFIDEFNKIKIGFFEFSINDPSISGSDITPDSVLQNFSYLAPEIIFDKKAFYTSDVYSVGLIAYYLLKYHKNDKDRDLIPLTASNNTIEGYKSNFNSVDGKLSNLSFEIEDNELLRKCLIRTATSRPILKELIENNWFNDPKLKALNFIEHLEQNDSTKNNEFLQKFPKIINMFENKIIEKRFLPALINGLKTDTLIVPCLPPIFAIAEKEDLKINFQSTIWPALKGLFSLKSMPASGLYFLLSKVKFIGDKISNSEFTASFLNIICKAMDCNVAKLQTVVSDNLLVITKKIDSLSFKNQIYPRIINILSTTNSHSLKIQLLTSLKSLYTLLDQNIINDNLLTNLDKIRKGDNSAEICMLISSIYEEIAKIVSVNAIANKILPNLISILVSGNISKGNFDTLMQLVHKYLDRIKKDREKDLYDDKKEQQGDNFLNDIKPETTKIDNSNQDDFLSSFFSANNKSQSNTSSTQPKTSSNFDFTSKMSMPITTPSTNNNFDLTLAPKTNKNNTPSTPNISLRNSNTISNPVSVNTNTNPFGFSSDKNALNFDNMNFSETNKSKSILTPSSSVSSNTNPTNPFDFNPKPTTQNKQATLDTLLDDLGKETKVAPPTTQNINANTNNSNNGFNELSLDFLSGNFQKKPPTMNMNTNTNINMNTNFNMNFNSQPQSSANTFNFTNQPINTMNQSNPMSTNNNNMDQIFNFTNMSNSNANNQMNFNNNNAMNFTNTNQNNNPFNLLS